jgi:hypothetical protein
MISVMAHSRLAGAYLTLPHSQFEALLVVSSGHTVADIGRHGARLDGVAPNALVMVECSRVPRQTKYTVFRCGVCRAYCT